MKVYELIAELLKAPAGSDVKFYDNGTVYDVGAASALPMPDTSVLLMPRWSSDDDDD